MAYQTLTQMTANMLDPVRGWWDERQLSRVCPVAISTDNLYVAGTLANCVAGTVGFLNNNNQFVLGGGVNARNKMPLFARGGAFENDAVRYEGNLGSVRATATQGTPGATGTVGGDVGISCLVGTGAYELGTTAFSTAADISAGDLLMADATANVTNFATQGSACAGRICKFASSAGTTSYTTIVPSAGSNVNQIVGVATSTAGTTSVKNQYNVKMLYFYVNWWPAL